MMQDAFVFRVAHAPVAAVQLHPALAMDITDQDRLDDVAVISHSDGYHVIGTIKDSHGKVWEVSGYIDDWRISEDDLKAEVREAFFDEVERFYMCRRRIGALVWLVLALAGSMAVCVLGGV